MTATKEWQQIYIYSRKSKRIKRNYEMVTGTMKGQPQPLTCNKVLASSQNDKVQDCRLTAWKDR